MARAGVLELATSDLILAEVARVLTVKFHWTSGPLMEALLEIAAYTVRIRPTEKLDIITVDPSGNRILECAVGARSEYIVSGDGHLLRLREHAGIHILRPSELLDLLRRQRL